MLQFIKTFRYLELELPGLTRQGRELCLRLIKKIAPGGAEREKCVALQNLLTQGVRLDGRKDAAPLWAMNTALEMVDHPWNTGIFDMLPGHYVTFSRLSGSYTLGAAALLLGEFDFGQGRGNDQVTAGGKQR